MKITIVGRGRVGRGLASALRRTPHRVTLQKGRSPRIADADVVVLAVPAPAIAVTASRLEVASSASLLHCSGSLRADVLPGLAQDFKGLAYGGAGQQQQQAEAFAALKTGFLLALIGMLALMAIPFRSYVQPLVVMVAIPFGIVGAVFGHLIMGFDLSLMSMMGTVALSGVVVNDSLVMISAINEYRADGMAVTEAVHTGGVRRFRPIMLTSLTTFFGLAPMILEKSVQAQFLIPMALSLGFGIMFATFITLGIVPAIYLIVDDAERAVGRVMNFLRGLYGPRKDTASGSQSSRLEP